MTETEIIPNKQTSTFSQYCSNNVGTRAHTHRQVLPVFLHSQPFNYMIKFSFSCCFHLVCKMKHTNQILYCNQVMEVAFILPIPTNDFHRMQKGIKGTWYTHTHTHKITKIFCIQIRMKIRTSTAFIPLNLK